MTDPTDRSDVERRLRDALATEADSIEPSPDGLARIEEKLMARTITRTQKYALGGVAAAILLVVGILLFAGGDDDPQVLTDTTTTSEPTTSSAPTSSTTPSSTTTTTGGFDPTTDPSQVVFPAIDSSQRFDTPETVVQAFLRQYALFTDPVVSAFMAGDSRSGEFEVTRNGSGPVSVILVRQLDDDTWGVIGAESDGITPATPEANDVVTSPVALAGVGLAFEGTINVDVREQGRTESIGEGFVTASGTPPAGPYSGSIEFTTPITETGAIMYRELSAEDGTTSWVSITRVRFTPAT